MAEERILSVQDSDFAKDFAKSRQFASLDEETNQNIRDMGVDPNNLDGFLREQSEQGQEPNLKEEDNAFVENLKQAGGGVLDATQEIFNAGIDFADWAENLAAEKGIGSGDVLDETNRISFLGNIVEKPKSILAGGGLARGMANFLAPFGALNKVVKFGKTAGRTGQVLRAGALGSIVDFIAFDPDGKKLSNLLVQYPVLRNPVTRYLAEPSDSRSEGRFKNALEGLGLGVLTDGFVFIARRYKGKNVIDKTKGTRKLVPDEAPPAVPGAPAQKIEQPPIDVDITSTPVETPPPIPPEALQPLSPQGGEFIRVGKTSKAQAEMFLDDMSTTGIPVEFAENINLNNLDNSAKVNKALSDVGKILRVDISEARRGVQTEEATRKLAEALNTRVSDLLFRKSGQALNAEELINARTLLNISATSLVQKAKNSLAIGSDISRAAFLEAFDAHKAVQMHVSGAVAEAGRALRSQRMLVGMSSDGLKTDMIKEIINSHGGTERLDILMDRIASLKTTQDISRVINRSFSENLYDAALTIRGNNLISGIGTNVNNMLFNAAAFFQKGLERAVGESISNARSGTGEIVGGEAHAFFKGGLSAINEAYSLAYQALKTGEATGATKADEIINRQAAFPPISGAAFNQKGLFGQAIDVFGQFITLQRRPLMAGDEFFRYINYRAEATSLAHRQATEFNLSGKEFDDAVNRLVNDPPQDLKVKASQEARINTFNNPLSGKAATFYQAINNFPGARLALPYLRSPMNAAIFTLERTPVFRKLSARVRNNIAKGGAAAELEQAKLIVGSTTMTIGLGLATSGIITGGGPKNPKSRKLLMDNTPWRPYSIHIPNTDIFLDQENLGTFGKLLGMMGDLAEIGTFMPEARIDEYDELAMAALASAITAFTPEYMIQNTGNFLELLQDPGAAGKKTQRFISNVLATTIVPFSGLGRDIRQVIDPIRRDISPDADAVFSLWDETINRMIDTIPGLSTKLEPVLNLYGEPVHLPTGWSRSIISPLFSNVERKSPGADELVRLGMTGPFMNRKPEVGEEHLFVTMPSRVITRTVGGVRASVELGNDEYAELVRLSAGLNDSFPQTLQEKLDSEVTEGYPSLSSGGMSQNDEAKKRVLKKIISVYQRGGRLLLQSSSEKIQGKIKKQLQEKILKLTEE